MESCSNCGATLRPGAKFCTTCGTRLNEKPANNSGWGSHNLDTEDSSQETSVLQAVQPPEPEKSESASTTSSWKSTTNAWSGAYGNTESTTSTDDPASRFRSALDDEVQVVADEAEKTTEDPLAGWGSSDSGFVPPKASTWSYSAGDAPSVDDSSEAAVDTSWEAPSTWADAAEEASITESEAGADVDAAGFSDEGEDEVDYLSGDENIEVSGAPVPTLPPDEARDKAIALADELRRTIRMMSSGGESDHGAAAMALTEASLNIGDFSDIRGVLADVKNDPRDIQALGSLAGKVDRIESLLEEHASLAETIERAITELNG